MRMIDGVIEAWPGEAKGLDQVGHGRGLLRESVQRVFGFGSEMIAVPVDSFTQAVGKGNNRPVAEGPFGKGYIGP